jgi:Spy/CpxP family protein refolding chaperone
MKLVKFLLTILAVGLMIMSPSLRAQDGGGQKKKGGMSVEQQVAQIEEAVGTLTADQKSKIGAILTQVATDLQALPPEQRGGRAASLRAAARPQIRALLTPEQQAKYDAMPAPGGGRKKKDQ